MSLKFPQVIVTGQFGAFLLCLPFIPSLILLIGNLYRKDVNSPSVKGHAYKHERGRGRVQVANGLLT